MANGRLGKASIAPLETVAVYTNNSGAEASVSVIAQADDSAIMQLRIDDTSDALTATTTLLSEAYSDTYVKYEVAGTGLTETTTYVGRLQFHDPSNVTSYKGVFEYYDADSATTYTDTSSTSAVTKSGQGMLSWDVFSSNVGAPYVLSTMLDQGTGYAALYAADSSVAYYYGWLAGKFSGGLSVPVSYSAIAYNQTGFVSDPYEAEYPWVIGMNTSGYMSGVLVDGTTFYTNNSTTVSTARNLGLSGPPAPTTTIQYPYLRASKRAYTIDPCNQRTDFMICVPQDSTFDTPDITKAANLCNKTYTYMLQVFSLGAAYAGGNILYHEYNPGDGKWYVGYRSGSTGYVASYTRDEFIAGGTLGTASAAGAGTDLKAMGWYHGTLTLPLVTHTLGTANATYRTARIGPSLWALVATTFGSTSAAETFYSTDLQTWVAASSYFSPYDYEAVEGSAIIRSDAGAVTSTKSTILTLGTDGVLENNVSFSQYERTGLVLSNGDRIIAYNDASSTSNISIQVMGYEGN